MKRFAALSGLLAVLLGVLLCGAPVGRTAAQDKKEVKDGDKGQAGKPPEAPFEALLDESIDMKDFQLPMTLKEALGLLYEKMAARGTELPILIDTEAFKDKMPEGADIYDTPVKFPPFPKKMSLGQALELILKKIPTDDATLVVRSDHLYVTTLEASAPEKQHVRGKFFNRPFAEVLNDLQEQTGIAVVLDARVRDTRAFITATFPPKTNLVAAVALVADMAGLKMRRVDRMLYVTSAANDAPLPSFRARKPQPLPMIPLP